MKEFANEYDQINSNLVNKKTVMKIVDKKMMDTDTIDELVEAFNAAKHPDVLSGKKSRDQVIREFVRVWGKGTSAGDLKVDLEDFVDRLAEVTASIQGDQAFEQMMSNMKHQNVEEKVRLQQENERLLSLQMSLEAERKSIHQRMEEELQIVKAKMREVC